MDRPEVAEVWLRWAMNAVEAMLKKRLEEKGDGALISYHEILGVVTEEYHELCGAVESNREPAIKDEILDLAVAAVFGLASIQSGACGWRT